MPPERIALRTTRTVPSETELLLRRIVIANRETPKRRLTFASSDRRRLETAYSARLCPPIVRHPSQPTCARAGTKIRCGHQKLGFVTAPTEVKLQTIQGPAPGSWHPRLMAGAGVASDGNSRQSDRP